MSWRILREFSLGAFATYGAVWVMVESIGAYFADVAPKGLSWYGAMLVAAAAGGLWRVWPNRSIEIQVPGTDSSIAVKFGDIFAGEGIPVIPVNEYFDGELGDRVSERSLHGQFIRDVLGGQSNSFFDLTSKALEGTVPEKVGVPRSGDRRDRYAIGTTVRVDVNRRRYLLTVLAHTDVETMKASANVHDLWVCLSGLWRGIRNHSNGRPVNVPLIGSGLSGTGLPPGELLQVIMTSFLCHTKENKIGDDVTVVLPRHLASQLDLSGIKRSWS